MSGEESLKLLTLQERRLVENGFGIRKTSVLGPEFSLAGHVAWGWLHLSKGVLALTLHWGVVLMSGILEKKALV